MPIGSKYAALTAYLAAQPPAVGSATLTLAEVEAIIGAPLPRAAYARRRSWWSNSRGVSSTRIWRSAGWRVAALRWQPGGPLHQTVTFARVVSETSA